MTPTDTLPAATAGNLREWRADEATFTYVEGLFRRYQGELVDLTADLGARWSSGRFRGSRGTYDIEGELYYMVCRELGARRVIEMASATGWSTRYLAAAVAANGGGAVHSFELQPENAQRFQQNVIKDFPFVTMHLGDCRREFLQLLEREPSPFDAALLDVHAKDIPQFALREMFPRVRGTVFIHDVLPNNYPWNHPEGVFYLWLLLRGGVAFLPIATLVDRPEIQRLREPFTPRYTDGVVGTLAKGVVLSVDGSQFGTPSWQRLTEVTFDQFPAKGLDAYREVPGRLTGVPLRELLLAAARICRDRVLRRG